VLDERQLGGFMLIALIVFIVWSVRLRKKERLSETDDEHRVEDMSVDDMVLMDELDGFYLGH